MWPPVACDFIIKRFKGEIAPSTRLLVPQAANAKPLLVDGLRYAGLVSDPTAYVTRAQVPDIDLPLTRICAITLASSATVERFLRAIGPGQQHQLVQLGYSGLPLDVKPMVVVSNMAWGHYAKPVSQRLVPSLKQLLLRALKAIFSDDEVVSGDAAAA